MADKPVKDYDKFMLRFPDGMRDAIADRAKENGRSMNSEIIQILEDTLRIESGDLGMAVHSTQRQLMQAHQQIMELSATLQNLMHLDAINKKPK